MKNGPVPYEALCYPPGHPKLKGAGSIEARIERLASNKGLEGVITLPVEAMSGQYAELSRLRTTPLRCGLKWLQGTNPADVVEIPPRYGMTFRAGGCFAVMGIGGSYAIGGHAGLRSLLCLPEDREARAGGHETVVHAIAAFFDSKGIARRNALVHAFFGIDSRIYIHDPEHKKKGKKYRAILEECARLEEKAKALPGWGQTDAIVREVEGKPAVSLYHVFKAQALSLNLRRVRCEKTLPIEEEFAYTRHSTLGQMRNDVFLYRC